MDPLTHVAAGAVIAWTVSGHAVGRQSLLIGAAAALLPDADVLIRSAADPLLAIEHHRGFTHALVFAPAGGLLVALPFLRRANRFWYVIAAMVAWLSHGLLDATTTYGTQLYWPFSRYRVGLDISSIIDPLFTLILIGGLVAALAARQRFVILALTLAVTWLGIGAVQRERALAAQQRLAGARGELMQRRAVFPTVGNTVVWRSIYAANGVLRMDRLRVPWVGEPSYAAGDAVGLAVLGPGADDRMRRDFERFSWFSDAWVARAPADATIIGDARYSLRASRYEPVWGIRFRDGRTEWVNRTRERDVSSGQLLREVAGRGGAFRRLP
jgi:inner membrane protein